MPAFPCPTCGATLQVSDAMSGKKVRCGACQGVTTAPADTADAITSAPAPPRSGAKAGRKGDDERGDSDDDRPIHRRNNGAGAAAAAGAGIGVGVIIAIVVCCLGGCGVVAVLIALLVPALQKVREAAARTQTQNNMKQIALAIHSHHDTFKKLPPPKSINPNNPQQTVDQSWRVAILPFIGQGALFNQFDHGTAWDSPRNRPFANAPIVVYQDVLHGPPPGQAPTTDTRLQYFTGPNTLWPDNGPRVMPKDFPGGLSNTFLVAEAANPVPWSKSADMVVQQGQPLPVHPNQFLVSMADGSTRFVDRSRAPDPVLLQYIDPKSGNHPPID